MSSDSGCAVCRGDRTGQRSFVRRGGEDSALNPCISASASTTRSPSTVILELLGSLVIRRSWQFGAQPRNTNGCPCLRWVRASTAFPRSPHIVAWHRIGAGQPKRDQSPAAKHSTLLLLSLCSYARARVLLMIERGGYDFIFLPRVRMRTETLSDSTRLASASRA